MKLNKNTIIMIVVGLLIVASIAFYFYKQGKKTVSIQYGPGELPGDPGSGSNLGASNEEIKKIANGLYDDMDGFNWNGHDMEPYKAALLLNDNDIIKLYNAFNTIYQQSSGQTLTEWIDNEKFYNNEVTDTLINRLKKLNLT